MQKKLLHLFTECGKNTTKLLLTVAKRHTTLQLPNPHCEASKTGDAESHRTPFSQKHEAQTPVRI